MKRAWLVVLVASFGACAAGHNALGPSAEPCFRVLPVATAALHNQGRLVGVRSVSDDTAARIMGRPTSTDGVCLVALSDTFTAAGVDRLVPGSPGSGHYAVVAVSMRSREPLGVILTDRLPLRFHHTR